MLMKKSLLLVAIAALSLNMQAQPPADSTPTYPQGATYTHSSGTATITDNYSSSTQYYNVIQCTGGTLTMNGCTISNRLSGMSRLAVSCMASTIFIRTLYSCLPNSTLGRDS